jgi:hypothetical protein
VLGKNTAPSSGFATFSPAKGAGEKDSRFNVASCFAKWDAIRSIATMSLRERIDIVTVPKESTFVILSEAKDLRTSCRC